jgi:hypothetical protein
MRSGIVFRIHYYLAAAAAAAAAAASFRGRCVRVVTFIIIQ